MPQAYIKQTPRYLNITDEELRPGDDRGVGAAPSAAALDARVE